MFRHKRKLDRLSTQLAKQAVIEWEKDKIFPTRSDGIFQRRFAAFLFYKKLRKTMQVFLNIPRIFNTNFVHIHGASRTSPPTQKSDFVNRQIYKRTAKQKFICEKVNTDKKRYLDKLSPLC